MNNHRLAVALAVALVALACGSLGAAGVEKTDLFAGGDGGYAAYRIPGLVAVGAGRAEAVLAYCESRRHNSADWGEIDVTILEDVNVNVAANVVAQICGVTVNAAVAVIGAI